MVDSLDMTKNQRNHIIKKCIQEPLDKIIITHGTDTMVETAQLISEKINNKTIILTGAMIPFKFGSSDGLFNMGSALAYVQAVKEGIYIAMNGQIFQHKNVKKNTELGIFETI